MSELDEEATAGILGGGGDLYTDRLPTDWAIINGEELAEDIDAQELLEGREVQEDFIS